MKKDRKLAVQVSMIVTAVFVLVFILLGLIVMRGTRKMYIDSHNEQIAKNLDECRGLFMNPEIVGWVLDQWQSTPEMMDEPETETEAAILNDLLYTSDTAENVTMESLTLMKPEVRHAFLKALYRYLVSWFNQRREAGKYDGVFIFDIRSDDDLYGEEKDDICVIMECSADTDETGSHSLGVYISEEEGFPLFDTLRYGTYGKDYGDYLYQELNDKDTDEIIYLAMTPVFVDGTLRYVVCLEYDWHTFSQILYANLCFMALWGLIGLIAANALLILFMYRRVVRPLVQVNNGIVAYMETKDWNAAVRSMAGIRGKNEVGRLADNICAIAVEIDRYTDENLRLRGEQERVAAELALAARIQADSLPDRFPERPDILLSASMDPAKEVGGDFYDFFFLDENRIGIVIADVSDKGIPAALFMMASKNLIKNYAMAGFSPAEVLRRTNESLFENNRKTMFVTVWFGILNLADGSITASNGGHEYPVIRRAGGAFELYKKKHSLMLGIMKKAVYTEYTFTLDPGGTLFLYTDGATEATDMQEQLFGTKRMLEALNQDPGAAPETLLANMKASISRFVGEAPQFDDLTMLCIKYLPAEEKKKRPDGQDVRI